MNPQQLTRDFVKIESLTPNEQDFAEYVEATLTGSGWIVERIPAIEDRWNLYARPSVDKEPVVVFCSHMDTVAPHIPLDEDDEYIYGRGSCDAKGVIACMIGAMDELHQSGESRTGLLLTVGEEVDSVGAKAANDHSPASVRYTVVGEPTENVLITGQKGIYLVDITTTGTSAHSAYPHLGESAVTKLLDILGRIRSATLPADPELGETTVNISMLTGGDRYNVIPDSAGAGLLFRVSTATDDVEQIVSDSVKGLGEFTVVNKSEPQKLVKIPEFEQGIVAFGSDVPYLTNWGERLMLGPGSIHDAHTEGEKISKSQMKEAVEKYVRIAKYLLTQ